MKGDWDEVNLQQLFVLGSLSKGDGCHLSDDPHQLFQSKSEDCVDLIQGLLILHQSLLPNPTK